MRICKKQESLQKSTLQVEANGIWNEIEKRCIDCGACYRSCPMMKEYSTSAKKLFQKMDEGETYSFKVAYSCMLCNRCNEVCPKNIEIKEAFHQMRIDGYNQKKILPFSAKMKIKKVENHQKLSFSSLFSSTKLSKKAKSVFIPGCSLTNYSPHILKSTMKYLEEELENVTMVVKCCSKPSMHIGDMKASGHQLEDMQTFIKENQIEQVIVACENCYATYKEHLQNIKVITLWEVIAKIGIPKGLEKHYEKDTRSYALHDPCTIRKEVQIHKAVRNILKQIGVQYIEFEKNQSQSECCGSGGMVAETDTYLWEKQRNKRANDTSAENIVSYCQCCVNTLKTSGKHTYHVLDFLFNEECIKGNWEGQQTNSFLKAWNNKYKSAHIKT